MKAKIDFIVYHATKLAKQEINMNNDNRRQLTDSEFQEFEGLRSAFNISHETLAKHANISRMDVIGCFTMGTYIDRDKINVLLDILKSYEFDKDGKSVRQLTPIEYLIMKGLVASLNDVDVALNFDVARMLSYVKYTDDDIFNMLKLLAQLPTDSDVNGGECRYAFNGQEWILVDILINTKTKYMGLYGPTVHFKCDNGSDTIYAMNLTKFIDSYKQIK